MGDHEIQPQQRSICSISQAAQPREAVDMTHIEHPARWKVVDMPHIAGRARRIAVDMPHIELPAEWNGRLCTPYRAPRRVAGRSHNPISWAARYSPFVFFGKK